MADSCLNYFVSILNQPHLSKKILGYIGNFKDIKNLALSNYEIYRALHYKRFNKCINDSVLFCGIDFRNSPNAFNKEGHVELLEVIQSQKNTLDEPSVKYEIKKFGSSSTKTQNEELELLTKLNIPIRNAKSFRWTYDFEDKISRNNFPVEFEPQMVTHVLKCLKESKKLESFVFYVETTLYHNYNPNYHLFEGLIEKMGENLSSNLKNITLSGFDYFDVTMANGIAKSFPNLSRLILHRTMINQSVSFKVFDNLDYLFIQCYSQEIEIPKNLKILVVDCMHYISAKNFMEGNVIDVNEIEYDCPCRTVGKHFTYSINHNVGVSNERLTVYFNHPVYYDFYENNLPSMNMMYFIGSYEVDDSDTMELESIMGEDEYHLMKIILQLL